MPGLWSVQLTVVLPTHSSSLALDLFSSSRATMSTSMLCFWSPFCSGVALVGSSQLSSGQISPCFLEPLQGGTRKVKHCAQVTWLTTDLICLDLGFGWAKTILANSSNNNISTTVFDRLWDRNSWQDGKLHINNSMVKLWGPKLFINCGGRVRRQP